MVYDFEMQFSERFDNRPPQPMKPRAVKMTFTVLVICMLGMLAIVNMFAPDSHAKSPQQSSVIDDGQQFWGMEILDLQAYSSVEKSKKLRDSTQDVTVTKQRLDGGHQFEEFHQDQVQMRSVSSYGLRSFVL